MKKLTSLLTLCLFIVIAKSQTPTLTTLIKYLNTPLPDLTEEVISIDGWELTKSEVIDSLVTLQFDNKGSTLVIKKFKAYKNEILLICNKQNYDNLNKSLFILKPHLTDSKVNENGHIVKSYSGETYGYRVSIAPKSLFIFEVYDKKDYLSRGNLPVKSSSVYEGNFEGSGFGETPIPLRKFTNLVTPQDNGLMTGKIAVRIRINKGGVVIEATPGVKGTTLNDRELWQKCKEAIIGARLSASDAAPNVQIGVVVFNFRIK